MSAIVRSLLTGPKLEERDRLALGHLDLVDKIARKIQIEKNLPPCFDFDDLVSAGRIGLLQAAGSYDPNRGIEFGAYARQRIKGAILDSTGLHNPAGIEERSTRRITRRRRWEEATRQPIAEHDVRQAACDDGSHTNGATPDPRVDLDNVVEMQKRVEDIDRAIATLPRRHAVLIEMHYRQEKPVCEIARGELFQVNPSRASQIHGEAIRHLRQYFALRGQNAA